MCDPKNIVCAFFGVFSHPRAFSPGTLYNHARNEKRAQAKYDNRDCKGSTEIFACKKGSRGQRHAITCIARSMMTQEKFL